jgi:archaemetzincin
MRRSIFSWFLLATIIIGCDEKKSSIPANNVKTKIAEAMVDEEKLKSIERIKKYDEPLGEPSPSDWLAVHDEKGQTFEEYYKSNPVTPSKTRNKIYLQPIGHFSAVEDSVFAFTREYLEIFFNLPTVLLPSIQEDSLQLSGRVHGGRKQLLTTSILDYLQSKMPHDGVVIMALTNQDLYPGNNFNFVFGQARTRKRVAVSSINRYNEEEPLAPTNYARCLERLIKTSSHEVGHMFSIQHCTNAVCVMNGSNSLSESDSRPNRLCSECLKKLVWNLDFDLARRSSNTYNFFKRHQIQEDMKLASRDFSVLK